MLTNKGMSIMWAILLLTSSCDIPSTTERLSGTIEDSAMVVSAHPIATNIGVDILKSGGTAIDAAVAVQFALAVVYPRAGNIGGGGFAVMRFSDGKTNTLDFREKAPALAYRDMYLDESKNVIPEKSMLGHQAAGVPGSVAGMWELHQTYGSLDWKELIQPAIDVANSGFKITQNEADVLNDKQEKFREANTYSPWVLKESGWNAGDLVRQPELTSTLEAIRDLGRDGFYKGSVADKIVAEMKKGEGLISHEDLANYHPLWKDPVSGYYKGHKVISMAPPSSGGVAVLQLLQGAEMLNIAQYPHNSTEATNLMAELEKRVFADRAKFIGDPDYYDVPVDELLSAAYNTERFSSIRVDNMTPSSKIAHGPILPKESEETTHFSIVDPLGNAVALTTTLNLNYGCKVWVEGAGFVLNNEMDDFSAKPGVPNYFGLIGAKANAIAPNKRMTSSMTPTIVEKDGKLKLVLGSPGGSTIITSVYQTIQNMIDYDMTMQEAVNAKKIHHQWLPDQIKYEQDGLDSLTIMKLNKMGHNLKAVKSIGRNDCILVREDGTLEGAADHTRGDDYAAGF
ncbi:MAG: gamma-glutamyltransferase [Cyclobacteriaceae bacterium]